MVCRRMVSFPWPANKMTLQKTGFHWPSVGMALRMVLPITWFPEQMSMMALQEMRFRGQATGMVLRMASFPGQYPKWCLR